MATYVVRRLLLMVPTLFLVTVFVFLTIRLVPGSVVDVLLQQMVSGEAGYTSARAVAVLREKLEHTFGLDAPIHIQYGRWVGFLPTPNPETDDAEYAGILQGNLGNSIFEEGSVIETVTARLPVTFELGIMGLVIGILIAFPVGILSAMRQDSPSDYLGRILAIICISVPAFWLGTMIVVYPSVWFGWSPPLRYISFTDNPLQNLQINVIPAILLGMVLSGVTMRMTRSMILEVLRQDYIRTAWAKGLRERVITIRHVLKNAFIPVVTIIGMQVPILIGGTVIIEQIFNIPGMGRLMIRSISMRDYPVASGINLVAAGFVLVMNLIVDISYAYLDPRIRYS